MKVFFEHDKSPNEEVDIPDRFLAHLAFSVFYFHVLTLSHVHLTSSWPKAHPHAMGGPTGPGWVRPNHSFGRPTPGSVASQLWHMNTPTFDFRDFGCFPRRKHRIQYKKGFNCLCTSPLIPLIISLHQNLAHTSQASTFDMGLVSFTSSNSTTNGEPSPTHMHAHLLENHNVSATAPLAILPPQEPYGPPFGHAHPCSEENPSGTVVHGLHQGPRQETRLEKAGWSSPLRRGGGPITKAKQAACQSGDVCYHQYSSSYSPERSPSLQDHGK